MTDEVCAKVGCENPAATAKVILSFRETVQACAEHAAEMWEMLERRGVPQ